MLPLLTLGAMAGGSLMSAFGSLSAGKKADKESKLQQALFYQQAKNIERVGRIQQGRLVEQKGATLGKQRTQYAKSGVRAGTGTPLMVAVETAAQYDRDVELMGQDIMAEAGLARFQGDIARKRGKNQKSASKWQAASSLLTGGAKLGSTFTTTQDGTRGLFFR